jgi:NADPH:quinone reductase-like Zn-dependent oxidoreductase
MRAAVIEQFGQPPVCRQVPDPVPGDGLAVARVRAAAVKNIERMLAAGTHYASRGLSLPAPVGMDAVVELPDGRRAYAGATPPAGAMAEQLLVDPAMTVPIPDGVDDAVAAALPNAGVSAWLALEYTGRLRPGQTVLVLGATGVTGALAVQLAKHRFGAKHVVATGRNPDRLERLTRVGADETVSIADGTGGLCSAIRAAHAEHPIDLALDYLWGKPAEQTLRALGGDNLAASFRRTRFVQIGEMASSDIALPAAVLRSTGIELVGQGGGSVPAEAFGRVASEIIPTLFDMATRDEVNIDTTTRPLTAVAEAWTESLPSGTRMVLVP